jgi:hypothetical protein
VLFLNAAAVVEIYIPPFHPVVFLVEIRHYCSIFVSPPLPGAMHISLVAAAAVWNYIITGSFD